MSRCSRRCCSGCRDEIHEERRGKKIQAHCIADCSEGEVPDLNRDEEDDEDMETEIKDGDQIFATGLHQPLEEIRAASTISQCLAEAFKRNQNSPDTKKGTPVLVEDIPTHLREFCQRTPQSISHYSRHLRQSPIHPSTQTTELLTAARDPTVVRPTCQAYMAGLCIHPTCPTVGPHY